MSSKINTDSQDEVKANKSNVSKEKNKGNYYKSLGDTLWLLDNQLPTQETFDDTSGENLKNYLKS